MDADIRPYRNEYWPSLRSMLASQWRANFPLLRRELFDWQYRGYGPAAGDERFASRVLFYDGEVAGFYGAIPGLYRLPSGRRQPGVALALWVVHKRLRGSGLGILLQRSLEETSPITLTLGANRDTVRYLSVSGYRHLPALHRWVAPLEADGYRALCTQSADAAAVAVWASAVGQAEPIAPAAMSAEELADRWTRLAPAGCLTLDRSADFFAWRYQAAAAAGGFDYLTFAAADGGFAIGRAERVTDAESPARDGRTVFRLIELWTGDAAFVAGLLAWARGQGCVATDYQCSNCRQADLLAAAELRDQVGAGVPAERSLAPLFVPYRPDMTPINVLWRVDAALGGLPEADATWLLKSDGDMDRPNV